MDHGHIRGQFKTSTTKSIAAQSETAIHYFSLNDMQDIASSLSHTCHVYICSWLPCMHRRHPKPTSQLVYYWALDTSQINTLIMEWFMVCTFVHISQKP